MKSASTYETILDVAQTFIQKRGFNGFSYRDLSKVMGIRPSSIHYHFPTKSDLGKALVVRYGKQVTDAMTEIGTSESQLATRLARYADLFVASSRNGEQLCLCVSLTADFETLDPEIRREVQAFWKSHEEWLTATLVEHSIADAHLFATNVIRSLQGAMISSRVNASSEPIQKTKEWIVATCC